MMYCPGAARTIPSRRPCRTPEEAEAADRVVVLHRGKLLADGTPAEVTAALGGTRLEEAFIRATA